jgi:hypothetical protein
VDEATWETQAYLIVILKLIFVMFEGVGWIKLAQYRIQRSLFVKLHYTEAFGSIDGCTFRDQLSEYYLLKFQTRCLIYLNLL